jgi:FkbM family methyltransferase
MIKTNEHEMTIIAGALTAIEIRKLVAKDNPVIIEIGANNGDTTAEFLKEMPTAKIYCFEPDPRALVHFKNRISSVNVRLFESAIGSETGDVIFYQSDAEGDRKNWSASSSIRKPKTHLTRWPWVKFEKTIVVPITRLDDWALSESVTEVDFVWADVQGAEIDLILGGLKTLKNTKYF